MKEFIITEYGKFLFTWESHIAIGAKRTGNCFIIGNILIIDHWSHEEAGYLILEFQEQLMKLPVWNKTHFYCLSSSLRDVSTGQNLSNWFSQQQIKKDKINTDSTKTPIPGMFRLGKYKIVVGENGKISFQTYDGLNKTIYGQCVIESGILFIGSTGYDIYESKAKRDWLLTLRKMPQWDKTFAWGYWKNLQNCYQEKELKKTSPVIQNLTNIKISTKRNIPFFKSRKYNEKRRQKNLFLNFEHFKFPRYNFPNLKEWRDRLFFLLIEALLIGFRIFLLFMESIVNWSCIVIESLHKRIKK